jgi:hypothetical protein
MYVWIVGFAMMTMLTGTTYKPLYIRLKTILIFAFQFELDNSIITLFSNLKISKY